MSTALLLAGYLLVVLALLVGGPLMLSARRRGRWKRAQSAGMGPFDEIFHPGAYQATISWEVQTELPAPAPLPGDEPGGGDRPARAG